MTTNTDRMKYIHDTAVKLSRYSGNTQVHFTYETWDFGQKGGLAILIESDHFDNSIRCAVNLSPYVVTKEAEYGPSIKQTITSTDDLLLWLNSYESWERPDLRVNGDEIYYDVPGPIVSPLESRDLTEDEIQKAVDHLDNFIDRIFKVADYLRKDS